MKNDEKAVIAGAGVMLAYFLLKKKEKKVDIPDLSISPPIFYV